eukprot:Trichotokara_eunicae@DN5670_c0_g1_i1.p2
MERGEEGGQEALDVYVPTGVKKNVRYKDKDGRNFTAERVVLKARACLVCRIILGEDQFNDIGCPNCPFLNLEGNRESIFECTTASFNGWIVLMKPEGSWVARYNALTTNVPGCYAVTANGELPESLRDQIPRAGPE